MTDANSPIQIGKRTVKNRIAMAPTVKFCAGGDGLVPDELVRHYEERAEAGTGLIVVEATCVAKEARLHPTQIGLWDDSHIAWHRRLADAAHSAGAVIIPQLHHGGLGTHPDCGPMTSPSAVKWNDGYDDAYAEELDVEQIKIIERQFLGAALRAKEAGHDGVQLHGCHAYLINDFASRVNRRNDEYGGSIENMARLGSEIISSIREACGDDFIISMRISGADPSVEEAPLIAEQYVKAGCDLLQVSNGIGDCQSFSLPKGVPYNHITALGIKMHEHFKGRVPVSVVNGINTVEKAIFLLEHELTDMVDIGRGLLADPAFTSAILHGGKYVKCFECPECAYLALHSHLCPAMQLRD